MNFIDFAKKPPAVLHGTITVNDKAKTGQFRPKWNHWSNSLIYAYYTETGRKGTGGFTLKRAYNLYQSGQLTIKPANP